MKKYLIGTIIIWLATVLLVVAQMIGCLPLNIILFGTLSIGILFLAIKFPRQTFWLFLAMLPLENIIISPENIPVAIRPFQLIGGILLIVLLLSAIFKNKVNIGGRENASGYGKIKFKLLRLTLPSLAIFKMEKIKTKDSQIYLNPIDRLVIFLGVASLIGVQFAPNPDRSLKLSLVFFSFLIFYWVARNFTRSFKHLLENVWFFLIGVDVVLIFGLYQKIAEKFGWLSFQVMDKRVNSTFTEPNWLGMYLVFALAVFLGVKYLFNVLHNNNKKDSLQALTKVNSVLIGHWSVFQIGQVIVNVYLFFIATVVITTASRSAWLGATGVLVIYGLIIWLKQSSWQALRTVFLMMGIIILAIGFLKVFGLSDFHLVDRATSSASGMQKITISCQSKNNSEKIIENNTKIENLQELEKYGCKHINLEEIEQEIFNGNIVKEVFRPDPSIGVRKDVYKKSWLEIKKNWLFGQGLGSSSFFLGKDDLGHGLNSSNIFLEVLISMGVIGLMLFVIILATPFIVGLKLLQIKAGKYGKQPKEIIGVFFLLTFFAIIIPNLFNTGFLIAFLWIWLAMVMSYLSTEK